MASPRLSQVFFSDEKRQQRCKDPSNTEVAPDRVGAEIAFAVDDPDLQSVIERVTKLFPRKAFCLLNERLLFEQAKRFQRHFLPNSPQQAIAYAVKANPRARILEIFQQAGLSFAECCSPGELEQVQSHWPQARIIHSYPSKFEEEIQDALDRGVRYFTVEDQPEVSKILKESRAKGIPDHELEISIRVAYLNDKAEINLSQKFGASVYEAIKIARFIRDHSLCKLGVSTNTGSQNLDANSYAKALETILLIGQTGGGPSSLNLGGGFPVAYSPESKVDLEMLLTMLSHEIRLQLNQALLPEDPRIIIEPGRALVAEAIDLIIPIRNRKEQNGEEVLLIDDGIYTCFIDALVHNWTYHFEAFGNEGRKLSGEKQAFKLFGRSCDSGDGLIQKASLPSDIQPSDYLHVRKSGAYIDSTGTIRFNGFEKPEYVSYNLLSQSSLSS